MLSFEEPSDGNATLHDLARRGTSSLIPTRCAFRARSIASMIVWRDRFVLGPVLWLLLALGVAGLAEGEGFEPSNAVRR